MDTLPESRRHFRDKYHPAADVETLVRLAQIRRQVAAVELPTVPSTELHKRAAESAKETRGTVIKLTAGAIGVLFFIATREIKPPLDQLEKLIILSTIVFMVGALSAAIWFGYSDAQWSYWWGVELDPERAKERDDAKKKKDKWHTMKRYAERLMLAFFVIATISGGAFVLARTF